VADDDKKDYSAEPMDWSRVRVAVVRTERSWPILGPIVAVVANWRAWVIGATFFLWLRGDDIIRTIAEGMK
jgi:hypothetical protein